MRRTRVLHFTFAQITTLLLLAVTGLFYGSNVSAAEFTTRRLAVGNNTAGATTTYRLSFSGQSGGTVGSIRLQLCANDPFYGTPCTPPLGLDMSNASLISQTGMSGFSIHSTSTANEVILTHSPILAPSGMVVFELSNIINPSSAGTIYGRLETFASTDATGASKDAAGIAVAYLVSDIDIRTTVPPYLLFCIGNTIQPYDCSSATGNFSDFGEFSPTRTATANTQVLVATNAEYGYTIRALGTTLTSGINVIPALSSPDISRLGVSQFGMNLRANGAPPSGSEVIGTGVGGVRPAYNTPNYFTFIPGDVLISSTTPDRTRIYTVTYMVNVSSKQTPGIYVSTLTYVALASF